MQINGATRAGGSAGDNNGPVPETDELVHCQSSGSVLDVEGRGDLTGGKGGGEKAGGGRQVREGAERGAQSSVDGKCARTRMGKKGTVPYVLDGRFLHCRF